MSSNETQQELCKFFQIVITGMRRLDKCLEYIQEATDNSYIPQYFKNSVCRLEYLQEYLQHYKIEAQAHELKDLIGRLGGYDEKLFFQKFQERYLKLPGNCRKKEIDQYFLRLIYEEIKLEKQLDEQRLKLMKRWDYNVQTLFNKLSLGTKSIDISKLKKFFIRVRYTATDDEILLLLKRVGNGEGTLITYEDFCQAIKTQKQRVTEKIDVQPMLKASSFIKKETTTVGYMDKLRRRYKPIQVQQSFIFTKSDQKGCHTPRAKTPTTLRNTEIKQPRTKTPNQNTEPRHYTNDTKELQILMSIYLNQQRCLQNVLAQLDDEVIQLKSLTTTDWHKDWQNFGVNSQGVTYEQFINVLANYDARQHLKKTIKISELQTSALTVADNLFELLREQDKQLQKSKLQFLREGNLSCLDKYFIKGYMDILDVLQILEHSTMSTVNLQDAELLIAKFNNYNGIKNITRKVLLNELT